MSERILRVNSEIQKAISDVIANELRNPKIRGIITVTKVDTTADLDQSKIFVSILDKNEREEVFNAIKHSAGFIRRELAKRIELRKIPFLTFFLDESFDYGQKIDMAIEKISSDRHE